MKRLIILITIVVIICFVVVFVNAQNSIYTTQIQQSKSKCSLYFGRVLDGSDKHLELFENKAEYLLETGSFWENCLLNYLQDGQDISVDFIGYTKETPTKTELKYLLKSAVTFKEELEDYIEEKTPKTSPFHDTDKYILLNNEIDFPLPKNMQKILSKENKNFDITSPNGRIFINISVIQNQQNYGGILVRTIN